MGYRGGWQGPLGQSFVDRTQRRVDGGTAEQPAVKPTARWRQSGPPVPEPDRLGDDVRPCALLQRANHGQHGEVLALSVRPHDVGPSQPRLVAERMKQVEAEDPGAPLTQEPPNAAVTAIDREPQLYLIGGVGVAVRR